MGEFTGIATAIIGGITPVLLWLWFWLREDAKNPEPRHLIFFAFVAGMITVALVIPMQKFAAGFLAAGTVTFIAWSFIEEATKYVAGLASVLLGRDADEPIDMVIYMITIALGFAAVENALFLLSPLAGATVIDHVMTGNLRFIGATLLHVLASAVVGISLALTFYKPLYVRLMAGFGGVILGSLLHSLFNIRILSAPDEHLLRTFALVWIGVIVLLAIVEYIKRIKPRVRRR